MKVSMTRIKPSLFLLLFLWVVFKLCVIITWSFNPIELTSFICHQGLSLIGKVEQICISPECPGAAVEWNSFSGAGRYMPVQKEWCRGAAEIGQTEGVSLHPNCFLQGIFAFSAGGALWVDTPVRNTPETVKKWIWSWGSGYEMVGKSYFSGLSAVCTESIHESSVKTASLWGQVLSVKN